MNNIKVTLLHHTPLHISADGARTCWASQDKSDTCRHENYHAAQTEMCSSECIDCGSLDIKTIEIGPKDLALIDRVGNQFHHASILEHITFNFFIDGISRACLQELCRHRMSSFSVKSSRYTLKELKDDYFTIPKDYDSFEWETIKEYILLTGELDIDIFSARALKNLSSLIQEGVSNDKAKYCMPESYRTQLTWTINMRSLQNFLSLRTDRKALPEIQLLAHLIYEALPVDAQSLVAHCIKGREDATV